MQFNSINLQSRTERKQMLLFNSTKWCRPHRVGTNGEPSNDNKNNGWLNQAVRFWGRKTPIGSSPTGHTSPDSLFFFYQPVKDNPDGANGTHYTCQNTQTFTDVEPENGEWGQSAIRTIIGGYQKETSECSREKGVGVRDRTVLGPEVSSTEGHLHIKASCCQGSVHTYGSTPALNRLEGFFLKESIPTVNRRTCGRVLPGRWKRAMCVTWGKRANKIRK